MNDESDHVIPISDKMSAAMKVTIIFLVFCSFVSGDRKVSTSIAHQCITKDDNTTVCGSYAHIQAVGDQDVMHYLVTTLGVPTVFAAYTELDVTVSVDWDRLLSGNLTQMANSMQLVPQKDVHYSYTVLFTKLIDYNDTDDKADMSGYDPHSIAWNIYHLDTFTWDNISETSNPDDNIVVLRASSNTPTELWQYNGTFSVKLKAFGSSGREDQLPHMQYTENITQFDLDIDHVWTNLSMSRFGVEVVMIGADGNDVQNKYHTASIDDEYAPGVFLIYNWLTKTEGDGGFLQWRPVCYTSLSRSRSVATGMKNYGEHPQPVSDMLKDVLMHTLGYSYYGDMLNIDKMARASNYSFGIGQDGGYNKTQVLSWSGSIGYGEPPQDSVSTIVIIIISAGLGIPVVLILFGGIFVCIKKRSAKSDKPLLNVQSNGYQPINDN